MNDRVFQLAAFIASVQLLAREAVRAMPQRVAHRIASGTAPEEALRIECQRTAGELVRITETMQAGCVALMNDRLTDDAI